MENLKALVYKGDLTPYQRVLAQREFKDLVERLELLEKAVKNNAVLPHVSGSLPVRLSDGKLIRVIKCSECDYYFEEKEIKIQGDIDTCDDCLCPE